MHGQVTQDDKQLIDCWNASASFEACYQQWNNRLNYLMHTCFKKKCVFPGKGCIIGKLDNQNSERIEKKLQCK